jgi:hypothetical protein
MCWNTAAVTRLKAGEPLLGAKLLASLPVTLMEYVPPGVLLVVVTVSVELPAAPLVTVTGFVLNEHVGAELPVIVAQESVTLPL